MERQLASTIHPGDLVTMKIFPRGFNHEIGIVKSTHKSACKIFFPVSGMTKCTTIDRVVLIK